MSPPAHGDGPPYPDVAFDSGKAQEVIRQLDALIPVLDRQKLDRRSNGQKLRQSWKGHYAVEFDGELQRMWFGCGDLVTRARALRARLADAIVAARVEQRWRDQQNEAWRASRAHHPPVLR